MAVLTTKSQPRVLVAANSFIPHFHRKALGAALGAVVTGLALTAGQAKALTVSVDVGGTSYDVTTFIGSYNDDRSKFTVTSMPWWKDQNLAGQFAVAVGFQISGWNAFFGIPDHLLFAYGNFGFYNIFSAYTVGPTWNTTSHLNGSTFAYATATLGSSGPSGSGSNSGSGVASVPGPLPILGLAAAFGFSRKLRERMKR